MGFRGGKYGLWGLRVGLSLEGSMSLRVWGTYCFWGYTPENEGVITYYFLGSGDTGRALGFRLVRFRVLGIWGFKALGF